LNRDDARQVVLITWSDSAPVVTLLDTLEALTEFQRAGKIRYIGVSRLSRLYGF
jgi:diketogulonate reductase-like aldo/keto reductase